MAIKIAINGFGRVGRLAFRQIVNDDSLELVAINSHSKPEMLAYLLKYDTAHGVYREHELTYSEDAIFVDDKKVTTFRESNPADIPWGDLDVDIVLECTGQFASKEKSQVHLDSGAKRVLISAPGGNDVPTVVYGTNQDILKKEDTIVSGASCTTNCLAPMAKALNDFRPIKSGLMSTIHAYTSDQMILDKAHKKGNFRRSRAGASNIIPTTTGAAKAIGLVIPELAGKMVGSAQRVPVVTGSLTILDAIVDDPDDTLTIEAINAAMKAAADGESYAYNEDMIVSSDIIGMTYGSLFDATQTELVKFGEGQYQVRVVAWYDNETSYVSQLVRTLKHMAAL